MIPETWLTQAAQRIAPYIKRTPLRYDPALDLYLKLENQQVTGSFKARGALNKVLNLEAWEQAAGLVTASAGNHGQGVALAGQMLGAPVTIFCSQHAVPSKVERMRSYGAQVIQVAGGYGEAEQAGILHAASTGGTWVSAYNDGQVIAGQGTVALEILEELGEQRPAVWVVPAGGGGLIAGIGAALQSMRPRPKLTGIQPEQSAFLHALYTRGSQQGVADLPTLADGLSGWVEENSITIPMAKRLVDEIIIVSEDEIARAVHFAWHRYGEKIEGSAAVGLGAILSGKVPEQPRVTILSGGNMQPEVHEQIINDARWEIPSRLKETNA